MATTRNVDVKVSMTPRRARVQMDMEDDEIGKGEETEEGAETYVGTSERPAAGGSHMETLRLLKEMKAEMKDMKAEMKAEVKASQAEVKAEMKAEMKDVKAEMKASQAEVKAEDVCARYGSPSVWSAQQLQLTRQPSPSSLLSTLHSTPRSSPFWMRFRPTRGFM